MNKFEIVITTFIIAIVGFLSQYSMLVHLQQQPIWIQLISSLSIVAILTITFYDVVSCRLQYCRLSR